MGYMPMMAATAVSMMGLNLTSEAAITASMVSLPLSFSRSI